MTRCTTASRPCPKFKLCASLSFGTFQVYTFTTVCVTHVSIGKSWTKKETHENIRSGVGVNLSNFIKSNGEMFAIPYKRAGGCIAYRKCIDFGKWSDEPQHWIQAHKKALSDFEFCPFADAGNLLATASNDEPVKVWNTLNIFLTVLVVEIEWFK